MKTMIKNIRTYAVILLATVWSASCSDLLDQRPQGEWTTDDIQGGGLVSEVMALYTEARNYDITAGIPAFLVHMVRSEDSCKGSTATDGADNGAMWDRFQYDASNGSVKAYWTKNYSIIHKTNTIIDKLKAQGELDELGRTLYAESSFFRAWCYFNLVRAYGQVPLIDFAIANADEANRPKAEIAAIYKLIDEDLTRAEQFLPASWEKKYTGRLTKYAAFAMHARTYMQRGQWGSMLAMSEMVINSKQYNLNTPLEKVFREEGENSSESIWELQCTSTTAQPSDNAIGSQFCEVQGVRGAGDNNLGWGWHMATEELWSAFEQGDPRRNETLLFYSRPGESWDDIVRNWGAPESGNFPFNEKFEGNDCEGRFFNKKAYCSKTLRETYGSKAGKWYNIRMIRYPDVLLMAAEAACEMGGAENLKTARGYLEQVRAQARGNNKDVLPTVTTNDQEVLRQAIRHERRVALALEPDRFYDLVRWDIASDVLKGLGYQPKNALLPLPQSEIDSSNGMLKQNPDYAN